MSGLITKTTKRRSSAPQKIRATKGKKSPSRKPTRPGKITASPRAKKTTPPKRASSAAKGKPAPRSKKPAGRSTGKMVLKSKPRRASSTTRVAAKPKRAQSRKSAAPKSRPRKKVASKPSPRKTLSRKQRPLAAKPAPPPPKKPPSPGTLAAVRAFEQALRLFNRHDFASAKPAFQSLVSKFGEQAEILARVRTYVAICEQRLARAPQAPRDADALYDQGVVEFNRGHIAVAIESFQKALKADPRADHVYYSLAAAYARQEDASRALDALRRAIMIRPAHRSHARRDVDFAGLRSNEDFQQLTGFGFDLIDE